MPNLNPIIIAEVYAQLMTSAQELQTALNQHNARQN